MDGGGRATQEAKAEERQGKSKAFILLTVAIYGHYRFVATMESYS